MAHLFQLTYKDFVNAQRLHRKHKFGARLAFLAIYIGFPIVAILMVIWALFEMHSGDQTLTNEIWLTAGWFLFLALFLNLMRPYQYRKIFRKSLPEDVKNEIPLKFSFGEDGVLSAIEGVSEGRFFWSAILDYAEDETIALLYVKKKVFLYIPKRAMPENEWHELRGYLREKTGNRLGC